MSVASPRVRVRAPELTGRRWLNTGGRALSMRALRGRIVVLDFWTFCCVNCLHVIDELRPLEHAYAESTVFVGVHSPKFEHEGEPAAVAAAVERYAVHHPVLDDPALGTWRAYTARAWPTLVVVDPEGYVVASMSGEGHAHGLAVLLDDLVEQHTARGSLRPGPGLPDPVGDQPAPANAPGADPAGLEAAAATALRFPGKVVALPDGSLLVSDTVHAQLVHLEPDLVTERRRFGSAAELGSPQGLALLPPDVAARVGYDVVLADSTAHRVLGLRLADGSLRPLAGTGEQLRERTGGGPALLQPLSTPWDVAWFDGRVVVAMAGVHQLWSLQLAPDPADNTIDVLAGTSEEGLRDGPAGQAWLAQPSGLASSADGTRLWVADSETSALRSLTLEGGGTVHTHVGQGLFDFGHVDGPASGALLQHPLGVTVLPDGAVAICDTYNGAVRRYDPVAGTVGTLATGLAEPSGAAVEEAADGTAYLVVVESAAHRLARVPVPSAAAEQQVGGRAHRTERPPTLLPPGEVRLSVAFVPPQGQKLDDRYGDPTRLQVSSSPSALLRSGAGSAPGLERMLQLDGGVASGILHVSVQAAACDIGGEHPVCSLYQQDWGIPVVLDDGAAASLGLDLRGV